MSKWQIANGQIANRKEGEGGGEGSWTEERHRGTGHRGMSGDQGSARRVRSERGERAVRHGWSETYSAAFSRRLAAHRSAG